MPYSSCARCKRLCGSTAPTPPTQEPLRDPLLYDTVLSREGLRRVEALGPAVAALRPQPEAVLVSPLTRQVAAGNC